VRPAYCSDLVQEGVEGVIDRDGRFLLNPVARAADQGGTAEVGATRSWIREQIDAGHHRPDGVQLSSDEA
jgi:hypothetical protein